MIYLGIQSIDVNTTGVVCDNCGTTLDTTPFTITEDIVLNYNCTYCGQVWSYTITVDISTPGQSNADIRLRARAVKKLKHYLGDYFYTWWSAPLESLGGKAPKELTGTELVAFARAFFNVD